MSALRSFFVLLSSITGLLGPGVSHAQADPRGVLAGMIQQLQTGTPNPMWYGPQLWQTIAFQTGNSGLYPPLAQLGQVRNIAITQQQQLPQGWLYAMTVDHQNGRSTWQMGINAYTNRIEYSNFNVGAAAPSFPLPNPGPAPNPSPAPGPTGGTSPAPGPGAGESEACRKFPNLC